MTATPAPDKFHRTLDAGLDATGGAAGVGEEELDGLVTVIRDAARGGCGSHEGCRDLVRKRQRDAARRWLIDHEAALVARLRAQVAGASEGRGFLDALMADQRATWDERHGDTATSASSVRPMPSPYAETSEPCCPLANLPGAPCYRDDCPSARPTVSAEAEAVADAIKDVCWRATPYGETEDGDTYAYLVTKGSMHRLIGAAQGAGISAAFRARAGDHECAYDTPGAGPCETCLAPAEASGADRGERLSEEERGLRGRLLPVLDNAVERGALTRDEAFSVLDAVAERTALWERLARVTALADKWDGDRLNTVIDKEAAAENLRDALEADQ